MKTLERGPSQTTRNPVHITRRTLLKSGTGLGLGMALGLSFNEFGCSWGPRPPNVVVITFDALRAGSLPFYGCPRNTAPFLNDLVSSSTLYRHCYSSATWTRPGAVGILTGLLPSEHDSSRMEVPVPASTRTWAATARDQGYRSAFITANPILGESFGMEHHFDHASWQPAASMGGPVLIEELDHWLGAHPDGPLCAYLQVYQPHGPYTPPVAYIEQAFEQGRAAPLSDGHLDPYAKEVDISLSSFRVHGRTPLYVSLDDGTRDPLHHLLTYEANILYADAIARDLVAAWKRHRPDDRTLFVFTSDHGEAFGENNIFSDHGRILQEAMLHVPLLIHDTGNPRATDVSVPVSHLELPAAIAGWMGAEERFGYVEEALPQPRPQPESGEAPQAQAEPQPEAGPRSVVSQVVTDRTSSLGHGEIGWALTRDQWRLVYNDAPMFGNSHLLEVTSGQPVPPNRPRVSTPIHATSMVEQVDIAAGVRLERLGFKAAYFDPRAGQRLSGRVHLEEGAVGRLSLRARGLRSDSIDLGTFRCERGSNSFIHMIPALAGEHADLGTHLRIEGAWIDVVDDTRATAEWKPLFDLPVFVPVDVNDELTVVGCALSRAAARAGEGIEARVTCVLRRSVEVAPTLTWQVRNGAGGVVQAGEATRMRDYAVEHMSKNPMMAQRLFRAGFRFDETIAFQIPPNTSARALSLEVGGSGEQAGTRLGLIEIVDTPAEVLKSALEQHAPIGCIGGLSTEVEGQLLGAKGVVPHLASLAVRFPREGQFAYLLSRLAEEEAERQRWLDAALRATPFHRSALAAAAGSTASSEHAPTLDLLTPSQSCRFVVGDRLLLYGFDLERATPGSTQVDLTLYWQALRPARRILMADLWTNLPKADGSDESAGISWLIGGDQRPAHHMKIGEAMKEKIRIPFRPEQVGFDLTLLVYPHWEYSNWGQKNKGFLPIADADGGSSTEARLGRFEIASLGTAEEDALARKRRDPSFYRMYDIVLDPRETTNRVAQNPLIFADLRDALLARIEVDDRRRPDHTPEPGQLSEGLSEELRSLGYVE